MSAMSGAGGCKVGEHCGAACGPTAGCLALQLPQFPCTSLDREHTRRTPSWP